MRVGRGLLGLLALTACDQIFDLEEVGAPPDARPPAVVDGRPSFCSSGPLLDEFSDSMFCYWAQSYDSPGVRFAQHDGVLDVIADGSDAYFAGCTGFTPLPFTDNGMYAHIPRVMSGEHGYTKVTVRNTYSEPPGPVQMTASFLYDYGTLKFSVNNAVVATRNDAPAWWRLRRPGGEMTVAAEVSADGVTWEPMGSAQAQMPANFAIDMGAGINTEPGEPGMATFAAIGVCD